MKPWSLAGSLGASQEAFKSDDRRCKHLDRLVNNEISPLVPGTTLPTLLNPQYGVVDGRAKNFCFFWFF